MKRYDPRINVFPFGIAAAAISAIVLTLAIYVPARLGPDASTVIAIDAAKQPTEVAISPSRIEVIGVRNSLTASTEAPQTGMPKS
jgi:hypothetical protein